MPNTLSLLLLAVAAFLLGWLLASVGASLSSRHKANKRDPRDEAIRSLEAELRVAQKEVTRLKSEAESHEKSLQETTADLHRCNTVITEQTKTIDRLDYDLKGSVKKTRELRAELADRAAQNVHAEAKIREVETELSVAKASADMLATGVLVFDEDSGDDESSGTGDPKSNTAKVAN